MPTPTGRAVALAGALMVSVVALTACTSSAGAPAAATGTGAGTQPALASPTAGATSPAAGSAADVLDKARTNALAAKSGAFRGNVTQNGVPVQVDFKGTADGTTVDVAIAMGAKGRVRVISVGGSVYMQADAAFWKSQQAPAPVQQAGNRFVRIPEGASSLASRLNLTSFLKSAFQAVTADRLSDVVTSATVNGVESWRLTDKQGEAGGTLYVAKATNELVRFTGPKSSPGQLDFSRWNQDLGVTAPPAGQVLTVP